MPTDPHALSNAGPDQVSVNQMWTNDSPPDILERYRKNIVPVQLTPSDRVTMASYLVPPGTANAMQIVGRQPEGIASRVSIRVASIDAAGGVPVVTNDKSTLSEFAFTNGGAGILITGGYILPYTTSTTAFTAPDLVLFTRDELWVAVMVPSGTGTTGAVISVIQEQYDIAGC